jgi:hypothetical protein
MVLMISKRLRSSQAIVLVLLWIASPAWSDGGPMSTQNHFPLFMIFLSPRPTPAAVPTKGALQMRAAVDYSRVSFYQSSNQWDVFEDMEMTVVDLSLKYGLTSRVALRLDVPLVSMNSGFLDHYVNDYHEALGVPTIGSDNVFNYMVSKEGQVWIQGESGLVQLTDITVSGQWQILRPASSSGWSASLLASLKLPTGEVQNGYGSGRMDVGLFAPAQWLGTAWSFYLMPGVILPSDPQTHGVTVSARTSLSFFAGSVYAFNERWQGLLQVNYFSSPLEVTGIPKIDDGACEMTLGARYLTSKQWSCELAFVEDLLTTAAPDFTVHLGVIWTWQGTEK